MGLIICRLVSIAMRINVKGFLMVAVDNAAGRFIGICSPVRLQSCSPEIVLILRIWEISSVWLLGLNVLLDLSSVLVFSLLLLLSYSCLSGWKISFRSLIVLRLFHCRFLCLRNSCFSSRNIKFIIFVSG